MSEHDSLLTMSEHDSLLTMMDALDSALPPALVPAVSRRRLRTASAALPFIPCVGLECHLDATSPRVDLLAYTEEQSVLRALLDGTPLGRAIEMGGEVSVLLERWVNAILFEFDLVDASRPPPPAVFLNFKPEAMVDGSSLVQLAACLVGQPAAAAASLLLRCAAAGTDTQITHLGAMTSRDASPLRINVGAASSHALREFVKEIGWEPERQARLDALFDLAEPLAHHFVLAFDFADRLLLPRVGLECYMASAPGYGDDWRLFLARLTGAGLCAEAEAEALLEWPGRTTDAAGREWPPGHARLASFLGARHPGSILRTLNHVKLVSAPGEPPHAKAYLVATHGWLDLTP
jgi:hypothetical protein